MLGVYIRILFIHIFVSCLHIVFACSYFVPCCLSTSLFVLFMCLDELFHFPSLALSQIWIGYDIMITFAHLLSISLLQFLLRAVSTQTLR